MSKESSLSTSTAEAVESVTEESVTGPRNGIRRAVLVLIVLAVVAVGVLVVHAALRDEGEGGKPSRGALLCEALDSELEAAYEVLVQSRREQAVAEALGGDQAGYGAAAYCRAAEIMAPHAGHANAVKLGDDSQPYRRARSVARSSNWLLCPPALGTKREARALRKALRTYVALIDEAQGICREAYDYRRPVRGPDLDEVARPWRDYKRREDMPEGP